MRGKQYKKPKEVLNLSCGGGICLVVVGGDGVCVWVGAGWGEWGGQHNVKGEGRGRRGLCNVKRA